MLSAEEAIVDLKAWRRAGCASLKKSAGRLPYGSEGSQSEKQKLRLQRWLADPKRGYSKSEFDELIRQFRAARFALGTAAMGRVLGVTDKALRDKLVCEAIARRWALSRIIAEIKRRKLTVRRPGQGRTVRQVDGARDAVCRLDEQLPVWLAQLDAIARGISESTSLGQEVRKARDALNDLRKVANGRHR